MKTMLSVVFASACVLYAQTPNFSGVWKVNPDKSKMSGPGPAPASYVMVIEQSDTQLKETVGIMTPRGEQRSKFTYNTSDKPSMNSSRGTPMRTVATSEGGALVLTSKIASTKPASMMEKYSLSPDGNVLTIESAQQTLVLKNSPIQREKRCASPKKRPVPTTKTCKY